MDDLNQVKTTLVEVLDTAIAILQKSKEMENPIDKAVQVERCIGYLNGFARGIEVSMSK